MGFQLGDSPYGVQSRGRLGDEERRQARLVVQMGSEKGVRVQTWSAFAQMHFPSRLVSKHSV